MPRTKAERCGDIGDQVTQAAKMAAGMLVAGLDGEPMSARDKAGVNAELKVARDELVAQCLTWDEEALKCFSIFGGGGDKCERVLAVAMGDAVAPLDPAVGRKPAWTLELSEGPGMMVVTEAGVAIVVLRDAVAAVQGGRQVWRVEVEEPHTVALPPAGRAEPILVLHRGGVLGIRQGGEVAFREPLPLVEGQPPVPQTVARWGNGWLIGDAAARFVKLQPGACAGKGPCMTVGGSLPGEYLGRNATLVPLPEGTTLLWEDERLRYLDADFRVRFDARALDALDGVIPREDGTVVALFDNDLVALDPKRCRGATPFAPSSYPQPNRMYFGELDACPECQAAPAGCVLWRDYVKDGGGAKPALMADGTLVVRTDEATLGIVGRKRVWSHALAAAGDPIAVGGDVLVVGDTTYEGEGEVSLWRLSKEGAVVWRALVPAPAGTNLYESQGGRFAANGSWAAVSVNRQLSVYPL